MVAARPGVRGDRAACGRPAGLLVPLLLSAQLHASGNRRLPEARVPQALSGHAAQFLRQQAATVGQGDAGEVDAERDRIPEKARREDLRGTGPSTPTTNGTAGTRPAPPMTRRPAPGTAAETPRCCRCSPVTGNRIIPGIESPNHPQETFIVPVLENIKWYNH